jgi:hypothetical protein
MKKISDEEILAALKSLSFVAIIRGVTDSNCRVTLTSKHTLSSPPQQSIIAPLRELQAHTKVTKTIDGSYKD